MKNQQKTVQFIPDKLFEIFSHYAFGGSFQRFINGFPHLTLIQSIRIDSQDLAIGLHREEYVTHFFLFDSKDAYREKTNKDHRILTVFAGKVEGIVSRSQIFKNIIYCDVFGKVKNQQNYLHALSMVLAELDVLARKHRIVDFEPLIPLQNVPQQERITEGSTLLKV